MRFVLLVAFLLCPAILADDDWGALRYLIGNWTGEGGGGPGQGSGSFSFTPDLNRRVLVRKNHTEYPATNGTQPTTHDDMMIVYRESAENSEGTLRADYFDSEGHVIHYGVNMFGDKIVFTSDPIRGTTQYRFTYTREPADHVHIKFEIAPPGKGFATYIEASAKKTK